MNVSFEKQLECLEHEVFLKSVDLDDDADEFKFGLNNFQSSEEIIAVAPKCVRCNLCVECCPVDAIEPANIFKIAKITDKCVQCEICVQTCPITAIRIINNSVMLDRENADVIEYNLSNYSHAHRIIRMNSIKIDYEKFESMGECADYCPTNALTAEFKEYFEQNAIDTGIKLEEDVLYPAINDKLCIGCGACLVTSEGDFIALDRTIGPVVHTKNLEINQDLCVNCFLCEENCPVEAIRVLDGKVELDSDKCIRCINCTSHCPVGALNLVDLDKEE